MTPDNIRELIAEAEKHQELVACGNAQHTNFDVGCPDCAVVCDYCTCPWPCDARKCADALTAAGVAPQAHANGVDTSPEPVKNGDDSLHVLDPKKVAEVLNRHLLGAAKGGTASSAWVDCSCGERIERAGMPRDLVYSLAQIHQADALCEAYTEGRLNG